jgi:hypothetical protein
LLGFLTGAILFGLTYQQFMPQITKMAAYGAVVLPDLLNLNPYLTVLAFGLMALLLFYAIDRMGLQRKEKESE